MSAARITKPYAPPANSPIASPSGMVADAAPTKVGNSAANPRPEL